MDMYKQSIIAERRGEYHLAALMREIIRDNLAVIKRREKAKKVVFSDNDY